MPTLYNRHHGNAPVDAVYIGRGSLWGNPYVIGEGLSREEALALYEDHVVGMEELIKKYLKNKDLVCYCVPKRCHGNILMQIANEDYKPRTLKEQEEESNRYEQ
jgi:hypothetical protein